MQTKRSLYPVCHIPPPPVSGCRNSALPSISPLAVCPSDNSNSCSTRAYSPPPPFLNWDSCYPLQRHLQIYLGGLQRHPPPKYPLRGCRGACCCCRYRQRCLECGECSIRVLLDKRKITKQRNFLPLLYMFWRLGGWERVRCSGNGGLAWMGWLQGTGNVWLEFIS